ncbi:protein phosphatase 1 regulatory subunit pprA-like [Wyeomyia smithii]|uniref:protein phosphatase 1 regulatory subunit pprA-like n=1 Tax=Wyeomyia smithii TaxID=174621 RepID=UPI002467ADF1|nr:protein phosphatase 1 regulatory subunit pprA-like [Wyeomyia smithii]
MKLLQKLLITMVYLATFQPGIPATSYNCTDHFKNYCVIENVTAETFPTSTFPEEKSLLIQNSTIPAFGEEQFLQLPTVENLMIHHLKIEQLQLAACNLLSTLFASYNHISELDVAEGLALRNLHLYQNLLRNVSALRVLTELEQLYLNDNLLEVLDIDTFAGMKNLKILTLHRNLLTAIDTKQAVNLPSLESLFLQHNQLTYLDTGLWKMPALKKLDLSSNELGFLFTFLEEFPALRTLELHDNKWNCAWLGKMVERLESREIQHSQMDATCDGVLFSSVCCLTDGAAPDPMMLLISRTAIVDDLHDQLGNQQRKVDDLEESQRKQTHSYKEMQRKIDQLDALCRGEL